MNQPIQENQLPTRESIVEEAVTHGVSRYILRREKKIDTFVKEHYSFKGSLKIHAHALGWDLIKVPVNIMWSVVKVVLALVGFVAKLLKWPYIQEKIRQIPPGLKTDTDRQIKWLIFTELLELPYSNGEQTSDKDALLDEIMADPDLRVLIEAELATLKSLKDSPHFRQKVEHKLCEYGATRTAAADLAGNLVLMFSSKTILGNFSFGALTAGTTASTALATSIAASNFWLGSTIGSYYYAVVGVNVSASFLLAVTSVIIIAVAFLSTFIGIITDPIQSMLGWHQRRLKTLLISIRTDLLDESGEGFELREKYIGRVFDIVDILESIGRSV
jgi:hypothetical protein